MALQFRPPFQIRQRQEEPRRESNLRGFTDTLLQGLPSVIGEIQKFRRQRQFDDSKQSLEKDRLDLERQKIRAQFGTVGETAGLPGVEPTPRERPLLNRIESQITPAQQLRRFGTKGASAFSGGSGSMVFVNPENPDEVSPIPQEGFVAVKSSAFNAITRRGSSKRSKTTLAKRTQKTADDVINKFGLR